MLCILMSLIGCYAPPAVEAETSYISDPCGALSKQITLRSTPDTVVSLNRGEDMIAEYRTDAEGQVTTLWASTSLDGVEAWVGRPNNHSTAVLSDPAPALEPVWREGGVGHMRCVGLPGGCTVAVDGTDLVLTQSEGARLRLDGRDGVASADGQTSRVELSQRQVSQQLVGGEDGVDRCLHATIANVEVHAGDVVARGEVWLSAAQAIVVSEAVVERDPEIVHER